MTYQGYMALANDEGETIELVNAARVKAYTDNLAPSIGLRGCDDCEGLDEALGETYTNPTEDNAPWYDPTDPATADFYGVYPLAFEGIDDSTRTIESAELTGDGSVVVGSRFTGKDIRVTGTAFAKDEAGLYAGMSWLDSALNGTEEGRCFGDRLNLYSSCPPIQVLPPDFAEPYTLDLGTPTRINVMLNPRGNLTPLWQNGPGTGGVTTEAAAIGAGLVVPGGNTIDPFIRYTWTTASTGGTPYIQQIYTDTSEGTTLPIGTQVAAVMYVRTSVATTMNLRLVTTTGAPFASAAGANVVVPANTWTRLDAVLTTTVSTNYPIIRATGAAIMPIGATMDGTAVMSVIGSTDLTYFDGFTPDTATFLYGFDGGNNNSYSLEVPVGAAADEAAQWTTTSGTITGDAAGIDFAWLPGDPQKVACREITGLIPGEQYQLRMRVENFGDYYVRMGGSCNSPRTNLAPNPRLLGWSFDSEVTDIESDETTGGPLGLGWRRSITTSSNTTATYALSTPISQSIPVVPGTVYQVSMYALASVGLPTSSLSAFFYDDALAQVGSEFIIDAHGPWDGQWVRLSGTLVAPAGATTMRPSMRWRVALVGDIQPNMIFGGANLLVEQPNYFINRTNLNNDPRAQTDTAGWAFFTGTGGAATSSFVASAVDGPVLYGTTTSSTYRRHTVTTANSGGSAGPTARESSTLNYPEPVPAGSRWSSGAHFRSNRTVSGTAFHRLLGPGGAILATVSEPITLTANVWQYVSGGGVAAVDLVGVEEAYTWFVLTGLTQVGDIFDTTGSLIQVASPGAVDESYFDALRPADGIIAYKPVDLPDATVGSAEVVADMTDSYFDGSMGGYHWNGPANDSTSSVDQDIDYETVSGSPTGDQAPTEPIVLDFIPRQDSIFLSITPTQTSPAVQTNRLIIQEALVRRTPRPGVIAFGTGHNVVPPSDGWTHLAPATAEVTWIYGEAVEYSTVRTDMRAPSASALTYTTAHGVERTLYGMIPGNRYRLMVEFQEHYTVTDVSPILTMNPIVEIGNSAGQVVTYDNDQSSIQHFWVIEFTALATSSRLFFHPNANLALGSNGTTSWQFDQYMVEEIFETDATPPQPGRFQARTMYEVKASQGPILTNVRASPCGVMGQITFSIRAGNPFKYRNPIFAGGLPAGTSQTVSDIPCSEDGLPQIINYAYNPSLETNATDYTVGGTNATAARTLSPTARVGDYVWRGTAPNSAGNRLNELGAYYIVANVTSGPIPLPGDELTVSIYFRATAAAWIGTYEWDMFVAMDGFPPFTFDGTVFVPNSGDWHRISQTFTLPFNIALQHIEVHVHTPVAIPDGGGMDLDGFMIQRGGTATSVFDETFPEVEWSGDPNTSALLLNQTVEDISDDPDCPSPPPPPAPPLIDDDCITSPTTYNRTVVNIPADTVPKNLTAYPVITLTAGSAPVRQARIRFWENPDNLTIDDLDPCAYTGEIVVSYLADGATMVIDGVLREATVSKVGFEDQNANHVLYGPDGGPVDWPELTGGIPYLVTLELDSDEPYTDTLMLVDLVVKD